MPALKASEDLRPLSDLKARAGEVVRQIERTGRPVILTRHGRGVAVVLTLHAFEEMQEQMASAELQKALAEGDEDIRAGRTRSHQEIVAKYTGSFRGQG